MTEVTLKNAITTKVAKAEALSEYMGVIDNSNCAWKTIDAMISIYKFKDICHGIINGESVFVSVYDSEEINAIYITRCIGNVLMYPNLISFDDDIDGVIKKAMIFNNSIIVLTSTGNTYRIFPESSSYYDDNFTCVICDYFDNDPIIDVCLINNSLWALSSSKLYRMNTLEGIYKSYEYPHDDNGVTLETIVESIGGDDIIVYANTSQLPVFLRFNITKEAFSVFTSSTPFTIVNAIVLTSDKLSTLYVYSTDAKVRTVALNDKIGFFDFNDYQGYQWVGQCTYYDGYVYNQYLDLTSGNPKLFLARSVNGVIFQIVSEDFDFYDEKYGKYCQGEGISTFITPILYKIPTAEICGVDFSRYCDILKVHVTGAVHRPDDHTFLFKISNQRFLDNYRLIDQSSIVANLNVIRPTSVDDDGTKHYDYFSIASAAVSKIAYDNEYSGVVITIDVPKFDLKEENISDFSLDFVAKIRH